MKNECKILSEPVHFSSVPDLELNKKIRNQTTGILKTQGESIVISINSGDKE